MDYFVGDLHGDYDQLKDRLYEIGFCKSRDRLFATGDLVDRGKESLSCLRLINEPWFYATLGNHEEMFLDVLLSDDQAKTFTRELHNQNGGVWASSLTESEEDECRNLLSQLPLARKIQANNKTIGVIHAGWAGSWKVLEDHNELTYQQREFSTWARIDSPLRNKYVSDIDVVISGHQNTSRIEKRGNQIWIDTIGKTGNLTILDSNQVLSLANK